MITMEKIDYVISVTGADYATVRDALLASDGNVDIAIGIIMGESSKKKAADDYEEFDFTEAKKSKVEDLGETISNLGDEIIDAVKEIWDKGNATKLVIMDENDEVILNVSMNLGAIWTVLAPLASLMGLGIGVLSRWEFFIYLDDGKVINIKDYITKKHRMR
ncbi:MAG: DUF4342 domain-containing protein [Peptoniphilus sp.]|nr:DUF4342 domain-containing protein [Peptoniphilus sp.]MDD7363210.1 DUF4342 domain-containing protein [Bacillota bacterium]MDY6044466.1 DUF4342 domain-containing protein [Peptoniphilus sp.]